MNNSVRNFSAMNPCHFGKASGEPFCAIANQCLVLSAKRNGTNEDKGSTMMLGMWLLRLTKRHVSRQSDVKQRKNQALALSIVELYLAEGMSESVSE